MRKLKIGLTKQQIAKRKKTIGGSDANKIMAGDWIDLWEEKTGRKEPEDLSDVLPVMLGSFTEEFNRYWYEKQTGRAVTDGGREAKSADRPIMSCTLDGMTTTEAGGAAIFEAKHVNPFGDIERVVQRYMPQLHHNAYVCGTDWAVLSVLYGTMSWRCFEVEVDLFYLQRVLDAEEKFWRHVKDDVPPDDPGAVEAPKMPTQFRDVDMTGNNLWGAAAADWLDNKGAAKSFKKAEENLKGCMEADIGLAFGAGVKIKRAKNGSLRISEVK